MNDDEISLTTDAETASETRTVDMYMAKLRGRLAECTDFEIIMVHGMGLALVKRIIDSTSDEIPVTSAFGVGSTFYGTAVGYDINRRRFHDRLENNR